MFFTCLRRGSGGSGYYYYYCLLHDVHRAQTIKVGEPTTTVMCIIFGAMVCVSDCVCVCECVTFRSRYFFSRQFNMLAHTSHTYSHKHSHKDTEAERCRVHRLCACHFVIPHTYMRVRGYVCVCTCVRVHRCLCVCVCALSTVSVWLAVWLFVLRRGCVSQWQSICKSNNKSVRCASVSVLLGVHTYPRSELDEVLSLRFSPRSSVLSISVAI